MPINPDNRGLINSINGLASRLSNVGTTVSSIRSDTFIQINEVRNYRTEITSNQRLVETQINSRTTNLELRIDSLIRTQNEGLDQVIEQLVLINDRVNRLEDETNRLSALVQNVSQNIDNRFDNLEDGQGRLSGQLVAIETAQTGEFASLKAGQGLITGQLATLITEVGGLYATFAGLETTVLWIREAISVNHIQVKNRLGGLKKQIKSFQDNVEEFIKKAPQEISDLVCLNVVGASYYKWDSGNQYQPTLTLFFKQGGEGPYKKVSQLKGRIPIRNEDVTEDLLKEIAERIQQSEGFSYTYGNTRCHYVHRSGSNFKTSVFVSQKQDGKDTIELLCKVLGIKYLPIDISYTENSRKSTGPRRTKPFAEIGVNPVDSRPEIPLYLYRAVVQINGIKNPIVIYNKKTD